MSIWATSWHALPSLAMYQHERPTLQRWPGGGFGETIFRHSCWRTIRLIQQCNGTAHFQTFDRREVQASECEIRHQLHEEGAWQFAGQEAIFLSNLSHRDHSTRFFHLFDSRSNQSPFNTYKKCEVGRVARIHDFQFCSCSWPF